MKTVSNNLEHETIMAQLSRNDKTLQREFNILSSIASTLGLMLDENGRPIPQEDGSKESLNSLGGLDKDELKKIIDKAFKENQWSLKDATDFKDVNRFFDKYYPFFNPIAGLLVGNIMDRINKSLESRGLSKLTTDEAASSNYGASKGKAPASSESKKRKKKRSISLRGFRGKIKDLFFRLSLFYRNWLACSIAVTAISFAAYQWVRNVYLTHELKEKEIIELYLEASPRYHNDTKKLKELLKVHGPEKMYYWIQKNKNKEE